jgi:hypothetical protein
MGKIKKWISERYNNKVTYTLLFSVWSMQCVIIWFYFLWYHIIKEKPPYDSLISSIDMLTYLVHCLFTIIIYSSIGIIIIIIPSWILHALMIEIPNKYKKKKELEKEKKIERERMKAHNTYKEKLRHANGKINPFNN